MKLFKSNFFLNTGRKKYVTLTVDSLKEEEKEKKMIDENTTGLWIKCPSCSEILYKTDLAGNLQTCPRCDYYFNMTARERINLLIDEGSFEEKFEEIESENPLSFPGYTEKYRDSVNKCDMKEGVLTGVGNINGIKVSIGVMDFNFLGGSMGSVVGEKITRAMELGLKERIPVIIVCTSGGARMHEGILSLMQMAKTSAAAEKLRRAGVPFISIPVNPTTGGVTASFAMLGDLIISEPDATIGFAGRRVIEQTIRQKLPEDFQTSEFLLKCGMVDIIAKRNELKETIYKVLSNIV
ncbi:acetyl-CoA carboxylase, carboxyltransferase subunit beta [Fusobacterium sp. PH5-44]|uniref:acetyl-CoA carboxylase, carboxyltransferase subunit beta n=1 Tax=unclassified Fusobacterium TaxID=2648384 RepID=UPI003D238A31